MEKLERIEQYLRGSLAQEAQKAFEQEMKQDPDLQKEVESYRQLIRGIEAAGIRDFEEKLLYWEKQAQLEDTGGGSIRPLWQRYVAVAAAVLALVAVLYLWLPGPSAETLFAEHFQPMEDYLTLKGETRSGDSAMALYQAGRYHEALPLFEKALSEDSLPSMLQLYAGISYLADQQPQEAIRLLEPLAVSGSSYAEPAAWYMALATLRAGDKELARQQLQGIAQKGSHPYQKPAGDLLERLKKE